MRVMKRMATCGDAAEKRGVRDERRGDLWGGTGGRVRCTRAAGSQGDGVVPNGTPSSGLSAVGSITKGKREGDDV
jgi:hypothetical protein